MTEVTFSLFVSINVPQFFLCFWETLNPILKNDALGLICRVRDRSLPL